MQRSELRGRSATLACLGLGLACLVAGTGCQSSINGQTLPSPWYQNQPVEYYAPGPQFKLSKEAAAMREYNETQAQQAQEGANR